MQILYWTVTNLILNRVDLLQAFYVDLLQASHVDLLQACHVDLL